MGDWAGKPFNRPVWAGKWKIGAVLAAHAAPSRVAVLNVARDTLMFVPAGDDFRPVGSGLDLVAEPDALLPESV